MAQPPFCFSYEAMFCWGDFLNCGEFNAGVSLGTTLWWIISKVVAVLVYLSTLVKIKGGNGGGKKETIKILWHFLKKWILIHKSSHWNKFISLYNAKTLCLPPFNFANNIMDSCLKQNERVGQSSSSFHYSSNTAVWQCKSLISAWIHQLAWMKTIEELESWWAVGWLLSLEDRLASSSSWFCTHLKRVHSLSEGYF